MPDTIDHPPRVEDPAPDWHPGALASRWLTIAAAAYLVVVAYILAREAGLVPESIEGATCGAKCEPALVLGVSVAWMGWLLMLAVAGTLVAAIRTRRVLLFRLAAMGAACHGMASLAFSASQWMGFAPLCPECQVANTVSVAFAALATWWGRGMLDRAGELLAAPALLGLMTVVAVLLSLEVDRRVPAQQLEELLARVEAVPQADEREPALQDEIARAMVVGPPDAPVELVVLLDLGCNVCTRFFNRVYPELLEQAEESGAFNMRLVLAPKRETVQAAVFVGPALVSSLMAGQRPDEAYAHASRLRSQLPERVLSMLPEEYRGGAEQHFARVAAEAGWDGIIAGQMAEARELRQRYFGNRQGSPAFVMRDRDPDSRREPFAFYGYQVAEPFLEYAGLL